VSPSERTKLVSFGVRFVLVFALLLMPLPWLPDAYVTAMGRVTNAMLSVVDARARVGVRFEPPARIAKEGSWKANLRVDDRKSAQAVTIPLDMRSFSYRPVATFVALAAASSIKGARRRLALWAGGLLSMWLWTTGFSALPLLSRFAIGGAFGDVPGRLVRTVYQATATPVMVYAMPVFVWWFWVRVTRREAALAPASDAISSASPAQPP
jgi:hypothetical protein